MLNEERNLNLHILYGTADSDPALSCDNIADRECARRLLDLHAERIRYLREEATWLTLEQGVWSRDHLLTRMMSFAEDVVDKIYAEAAAESNRDRQKRLRAIAKSASSATGLRKAIGWASRMPEIALSVSELDSDPWLLCCQNGVLDLRSGRLRAHRPEDYCTRRVPIAFDPKAQSDEWDAFLAEVQPRTEMRSFLGRAVGYSLTGSTDEEAFFLLHGPTATGKSTFEGAIRCVLADYAAFVGFETFLARSRGNQIRNDIARLDGIRFVAASECNRGDRLDVGQIKSMTGGDVVVARFLRKDYFEFKPQCKIWMAVNDRPLVPADDDAVWRRVLEVPFTSQICESSRTGAVKQQLQNINTVGPAILKWAVDGCLDWQVHGLDPPAEVQAATLAYRAEMAGAPVPPQARDSPARAPAAPPVVEVDVEPPDASDARGRRRRSWGFSVSVSGSIDVGSGRER